MNDTSNTRSMPLMCKICPKRPDFSDVSHLLTHAASKGHLSNYYRMKVKGSQDPEARRAVTDYDTWYDEWKVDDMMRERMSQKEKKRASTIQVSRRPMGITNASSRSTSVASQGFRNVPNRSHLSPLDSPVDRRIKIEPLSRPATPSQAFPFDPVMMHGGYAPPMQHPWITPYDFTESMLKQESVSSSYSDESLEVPTYAAQYAPPQGSHRQRPSASLASLQSQPDEEHQPTVTVTDSSKLKGVYWPGMAMFDAALPEARRKRNQKKASSVLQHLQTTSETVEPTELIFDRGGALRKQRAITGHPDSDDSLIEGESSPLLDTTEKKRARGIRIRSALAEKHPNTSRTSHKRNKVRRGLHPLSLHDRMFDDDEDLTYVGSRSKTRRTGLSIHRDNSGPEITFNNPAPFNLLTAGLRDPFRGVSQDDVLQPSNRVPHFQAAGLYQRQPALSFNGPFRPAMQNNATSQSFPSFGHYISHTMGHVPNLTAINPHPSLSMFDQQIGSNVQSARNESNSVQPHNNQGSPWNLFNYENQDLNIPNAADNAFHLLPDVTAANALFLDNNGANGIEDDQATISATSEA